MAIRQPINPVSASTLVSDINAALDIIRQELNNCVPRTTVTPPIQPGVNDGPELLGNMDANNFDINNVRNLTVTNLIQSINGQLVDVTAINQQSAANAQAAAASAANAATSEANAAASAASVAAAIDTNNRTHAKLTKSVAGGVSVTLTAAENNYGYYEFTGAITANINVIVDVQQRHFTVKNNTTGAFTLTVKTSAGTSITVERGATVDLYCDGVNVVQDTVAIDNTGRVIEKPALLNAGNVVSARNKASHYGALDTGAIKIGLGVGFNNTLFTVRIRIFNYVTNESHREIIVSGYNSTSGSFARAESTVIGVNDAANDIQVRLAHDGTQCCILLGDITTSWVYPMIVVERVDARGNGRDAFINSVWNTSLVTNLTGYSAITAPPRSDDMALRPWITPTYVNGWSLFSPNPSNYPQLQYVRYGRKVYIRGIIANGSNTTETTIFTLPAGYRPASEIITTQQASGGTARVDILPTGAVNHMGAEVHSGNATTYLYINTAFIAEQ